MVDTCGDLKMSKTILVTGGQGFICSHICQDLLSHGYNVVSMDCMNKYGKIDRPQDKHPNFQLINHDLTKPVDNYDLSNIDCIIAGAARIGGITYFSKYPYRIMRDNELILANTFDLALRLNKYNNLKKIVAISSSMVYEGADYSDLPKERIWPTKEELYWELPPPRSVYGAQKANLERWCQAAWEEHGLPFNVVRPFNCVGVGEDEALDDVNITQGGVSLMSSHVLPDLIKKALALKSTDKLPLLGDGSQVRHYTNGKDVARGIRMVAESAEPGSDFNISSDRPCTVKELATIVWNQIHGCDPVFECHPPLNYDVQMRSPDVTKAKTVLGFEAEVSLEDSVAEVISYMRGRV